MSLTQLAPGIHRGVPFAVYRADPGVNNSIFDYANLSAAHVLNQIVNGSEDTPTFRMGRALHVAVLEPDTFDFAVVVRPDFDGKGARAARAAWNASHADSIILTPGEMEKVEGMAAGVRRNPGVVRVLDAAMGASEATVIWVDAEFGVRCKARIDRYIPGVLALDVKTTRSAYADDFTKAAYEYNYHRQLAWYSRGLRAAGEPDAPWSIVAVENEAPFEAALFAPVPDLMTLGATDAQVALVRVSKMIRENKWQGYTSDVQPLEVPEWVRRQRRGELD